VAVTVLAVSGVVAGLLAVLMFLQKSLYSSAICLMGVLLQVAAIYLLLGAQILAFLQVLVYAGAIMVLIVIAIMAAPPRLGSLWAENHLPSWLLGLIFGLAATEACLALASRRGGSVPWSVVTRALEMDMAGLLFGRYALMTESAGLLILLSALALLRYEDGPR